MHHREHRVHREKQDDIFGDSFSVLQAGKSWKSFPDNATGENITLFSCNGSWSRAKAQSRKEKAYFRPLRLGALNECNEWARVIFSWFRPEAGL